MKTLTGFEDISLNRGYPVWSDKYECWVIGSFHPAFIARGNHNLMIVLREDIKKAVWLAGQDQWFPAEVDYILQPTRDQAKSFLDEVRANPQLPLTVDLENPKVTNEEEDETTQEEAPILQIQFSFRPYTGIVFPWIGEFKNITSNLLETPNPKWGHNSRKYDFPLLEREGFKVAGEWHDTMDAMRMAHSNIPGCYHLQGVASFFGGDQLWKHRFGENMEYYGAMDVDNPQRIVSALIPQMKRLGVWDTYMNHVVKMEPILVNMSERGLNRDQDLIRVLQVEAEEEMKRIREEMTSLVPKESRRFKDYKREPKEIKEIRLKLGGHYVDEEKLEETAANDGFERVRTLQGGLFWRKWELFMCSSQKLQGYCKQKGYKIPQHPKEDRPTMNEWALKILIRETKDPLFGVVLKYKEIQTIASRYLAGDWKPGESGKTHPSFFSARTASGQFSSRKPNSQQVPHD